MEYESSHPKQVKPISARSMLKRSAVALISFSLVCTVIAFVSPTWLVSWHRLHSPIKRLGLWEFCVSGFVSRTDILVRSYFGCWWIFAPYFNDIREILTPPWFKAIQAFMVFCLLIQILSFILVLVHSCCNCLKTDEQRAFVSQLLMILQVANTVCSLVASAIFGGKCFDSYWMPNPEINWPSWGFGMAVLAGFGSLLAIAPLWALSRLEKRRAAKRQHAFPAPSSIAGGATRRSLQPLYTPMPPGDTHSVGSRQPSEMQSMI